MGVLNTYILLSLVGFLFGSIKNGSVESTAAVNLSLNLNNVLTR